jgi:hypothetical protein
VRAFVVGIEVLAFALYYIGFIDFFAVLKRVLHDFAGHEVAHLAWITGFLCAVRIKFDQMIWYGSLLYLIICPVPLRSEKSKTAIENIHEFKT